MTTMARTVVLHKRPDYPSFGIYIGEDFPSGIYIVTIESNSPAASASIRPGDRVLAFNGHLVASMQQNPKSMLIETAASAQTLTLSIQSTNTLEAINELTYPYPSQPTSILEAVNKPTSSNWSNQTYPYPSKSSKHIDSDLEGYIKSLFSDPTLQIVHAPSGNHNEFVLLSDKNPPVSSHSFHLQPPYPPPPRHHHHHSKRRHHSKKEASNVPYHEQKENRPPMSPVRSVPSMGTSHAILRNSQLTSRDSAHSDQQNPSTLPVGNNRPPIPSNPAIPLPTQSFNPPPQTLIRQVNPSTYPPPYSPTPAAVNNQINPGGQHPPPTSAVGQLVNSQVNPSGNAPSTQAPNNGPLPVNGQGLHEVHVHRLPDYQGFGFQLQYNRVYYIIQLVETNSPAERGGLRENDIIREVNRRSTHGMPHDDFVHIINTSNDVTFLVQPFDDYFRANPHVPPKPSADRTANIVKNDADKRPNMLTKALTKLKSR